MTTLREAAQQALTEMANARDYIWLLDEGGTGVSEEEILNKIANAITALRAALAEPVLEPVQEHEDWCASVTQLLLCDPPRKAPCNCKKKVAEPVQEPVAWMVYTLDGKSVCVTDNPADFTDEHKVLPLYAAPSQRKPLTQEKIWHIYKNLWMFHPAEEPRLAGDVLKFARAIERAHGIGGEE